MRADLTDWIALNMVRGIGPRTANTLLDRFRSPAGVFSAARASLEAAGLKPESITELHDSSVLERASEEVERVERLGLRVVTLIDSDYPPLLREIYDPPITLYVRGDLAALCAHPCIAIVGSRRCSTYGLNAAESLARDLADRGLTIVSGLARGIDAAAHRGALEAGGITIGVIGNGLDLCYPREHKRLAENVAGAGALISEFPLSTPPLSQNFPYRNRVLSGLCLGVLVVEAAEHSGSLITARLAAEQGREIFAVPGNITSRNSFGPNYLIKDGAKLVQHWRDIVEELPRDERARLNTDPARALSKAGNQPALEAIETTEPERVVLRLIKPDEPIHIDQLLVASGIASPVLMATLLQLEMKDRIRQLPGKCFVSKL